MIANLEEVKIELKSRLKDYLRLFDKNPDKSFLCINPKHQEVVPSCSIQPSTGLGHCFSCSCTFDTFQACNFIEGFPVEGEDFIKVTIPHLAAKLDIELQMEFTEEEIYKQKTYSAYKAAAKYISMQDFSPLAKLEMEKRGWDEELVKQEHIGIVVSYKGFLEHLNEEGFDNQFLNDVDLKRSDLFNENNLIFTIKDEYGKPCGFAARNLKFEEEDSAYSGEGNRPKKYINSRVGTSLKCSIYNKSRRLYQIHEAKKHSGPLYIVEGYGDVITMNHYGIFNVVATGGTSFTDEHIDLLNQLKITNICLCFDGDEPGQTRMQDILDKKFSHYKSFNVNILVIPNQLDPDDFIRTYNIEKFQSICPLTPFAWKLRKYTDFDSMEKIAEEMIPLIVMESSYIKRDEMVKELYVKTGYDIKTIKSEVERLTNKEEEVKQNEIINLSNYLASELRRDPTKASTILKTGLERIDSLTYKDKNLDIFDICYQEINACKTKEENLEQKVQTLKFSSRLYNLQRAIEGNWQDGISIGIGGVANAGKSIFLSQIALDLASLNNDIIVFVQSLDDTREQWENRILAQLAQRYVSVERPAWITMNKLRNPSLYTGPEVFDKEGNKYLKEVRDLAYSDYLDLVAQRKLCIVDAVGNKEEQNKCDNFEKVIDTLAILRRNNPNKKIVWVLDNFHDLNDPKVKDDNERTRVKNLAKRFRTEIKRLGLICFSSVEYTKLQPKQKPSNNNVAESVSLEYAFNLLLHLYNDLHGYSQCGEAEVCPTFHKGKDWMQSVTQIEKLPIIEIIIGKNKLSAFKNQSLYFKMYPELALMESITKEEFNNILATNQTSILKDVNDNPFLKNKIMWQSDKPFEMLKKEIKK